MAGWTGLEPATSGLTGQRSNQLNYHPVRECGKNKNINKKRLLCKSSEIYVLIYLHQV